MTSTDNTLVEEKHSVDFFEDGLPLCIDWSIDTVADFIESLGFPQYRNVFLKNKISGRNLIMVDASSLPAMGITYFEHIKTITNNIRRELNIEEPNSKRSIALPVRDPIATFLELKSRTGKGSDALQFCPEDYIEEDW